MDTTAQASVRRDGEHQVVFDVVEHVDVGVVFVERERADAERTHVLQQTLGSEHFRGRHEFHGGGDLFYVAERLYLILDGTQRHVGRDVETVAIWNGRERHRKGLAWHGMDTWIGGHGMGKDGKKPDRQTRFGSKCAYLADGQTAAAATAAAGFGVFGVDDERAALDVLVNKHTGEFSVGRTWVECVTRRVGRLRQNYVNSVLLSTIWMLH